MKKELIKKNCPYCSKDFETTRSNKIYCSNSCKIKHNANLVRINKGLDLLETEKFVHNNIQKNYKPLPGDAVYVADSKDKKIKTNTLGIITGIVGNFKDEYEVLFNPYLPVYVDKNKIVSCASGVKKTIKINNLFHTGQINMLFEYIGRKKADDLFLVNKFITVV